MHAHFHTHTYMYEYLHMHTHADIQHTHTHTTSGWSGLKQGSGLHSQALPKYGILLKGASSHVQSPVVQLQLPLTFVCVCVRVGVYVCSSRVCVYVCMCVRHVCVYACAWKGIKSRHSHQYKEWSLQYALYVPATGVKGSTVVFCR